MAAQKGGSSKLRSGAGGFFAVGGLSKQLESFERGNMRRGRQRKETREFARGPEGQGEKGDGRLTVAAHQL